MPRGIDPPPRVLRTGQDTDVTGCSDDHDRVEDGAAWGSSVLPDLGKPMTAAERARHAANARRASDFLKAISHEGRMMVLCALAGGPRSVTELERLLGVRQAAMSQQLARLRMEGLVTARREGKQVIYSLTDDKSRRVLEVIYEMFCV